MAYQTGANMDVRFKVQSALGTPASGGSGEALRVVKGSPGLTLGKALIESNELRSDGMTTRGRHGSRGCAGSYNCELSLDSFDTILQAALRGTWTAASVRTYDNSAGLTSLQVTANNTITQVGTTTLIGSVSQGDMVKLGSYSTAADNDIWLRVTDVTATVITVAGTPLTSGSADTACTLTIARTLVQTDPPTERYFTFEQYNQDVDLSELFTDVKVNRLTFTKRPDSPILMSVGLIGLDGGPLASGASPSLTSPTEYTTRPLVMADGHIYIGGTTYTDLTGFEINLDLGGSAPPVLAPNPPDVFLNNARISGSFTGLITDFDHFTAFDNETQQDVFILMNEPDTTDPKDFISLYMGDVVLDGHSAPLGEDGPRIVSIPFRAGKDEGGSDRAATMIKLSTSAT